MAPLDSSDTTPDPIECYYAPNQDPNSLCTYSKVSPLLLRHDRLGFIADTSFLHRRPVYWSPITVGNARPLPIWSVPIVGRGEMRFPGRLVPVPVLALRLPTE